MKRSSYVIALLILVIFLWSNVHANDEIDIGYENPMFAWNFVFDPSLESGTAYSTQWKAFGIMTNLPAQKFEFTRHSVQATVYVFTFNGEPVEIAINIGGLWGSTEIDAFREPKAW
uniref:Uncharacterized protein n=1 Tax=viral metagenome TaxID=1070528 RepID=A0A6M3KWW1_9ZZZZ